MSIRTQAYRCVRSSRTEALKKITAQSHCRFLLITSFLRQILLIRIFGQSVEYEAIGSPTGISMQFNPALLRLAKLQPSLGSEAHDNIMILRRRRSYVPNNEALTALLNSFMVGRLSKS